MKIFAVSANYAARGGNKGNETSFISQEAPVVFMKPDSALLKDGKPFFIPDFSEDIYGEAELVVRICRLGKNISPRFAHRYYDALTVGIDFTARDVLRKLQDAGKPWEIAKGFDGAAVVGDFVPVDAFPDMQKVNFGLQIDGEWVQQGCASGMLFKVDELIAWISRFYTLKMGDLLFTGAPSGTGPITADRHLQGYAEGQKLLDFYVR